jgi:hypothetical protein
LGSRDVGIEVFNTTKDRKRTAIALRGKMLDAGTADSNERKLGRDKKPICEDEHKHSEQSQRSRNRVLQTGSSAPTMVR